MLCENIAMSALTIHNMNYLSSCDKMFPNTAYSSKVIVFLTTFFRFDVHYVFKHSSPSQVQRIPGSG